MARSGLANVYRSHPRPLIRVGEANQRGDVELQDLLFTTKGQTPGVILVEWNIEASKPGSAGMWGEFLNACSAQL